MIKALALGLWASAVTVGATYGAIEWQLGVSGAPAAEEGNKLEEVRTKAINVPIIADGAVQGYIVAQFVFTVDAKALHELSVKPEVYLLDEAFKTIYAGEKVNFRKLQKQDLPALAKLLGDNVNKRLGITMVHDVLIDQLSYVPKDEARVGRKSS